MYYNPHDLLTHNCLFNFVIGNRGGGKTYSSKKWAIKSFLKDGSQFIYLRRYKTEFKDFNFFADLGEEFPDLTFETKGQKLLINGEIAGYLISLATSLMRKSTSFHKVNKIIYDEFVIDSKVIHYLNNEVTAFLEFYETVARLRDNVRVLFLSNAVSVVNPYFLYWNIKPNPNRRFTKMDHLLVEFVKNEEFVKAKYETKFGQIIKGTKYGNYAIENEYLKDNSHFIEKKTGDSRYEFSIVFHGQVYGFWNDYKAGVIFVSKDIDPFNKLQFVLTDQDHKPNLLLVRNARRSHLLSGFLKAYEGGYMRFEDMVIKNQCLEIFRMLKSG